MLEIFQYDFMVRGMEAGILVAFIAPLIGIFLVLRRYSLIADTLAHISLAGIAFGLVLGWNPVITALGTTVLASLGIDKLRTSKKISGESALALFLSGSLAFTIVLLSFGDGLNSNFFSYLFGSIVTVTSGEVKIMALLSFIVVAILFTFYKELVYVTFDEESAKVSGINTRLVNTVLIVLSALVVSLAIPVVGVLLISALIVIPAVTALKLRKSFTQTIVWAELISILSVVSGIILSYYLDLATGGTIILIMLFVFTMVLFSTRHK